ncbi:MAG: hypothetical protein A3D67_01050 [Candidatus Lloydbacteria bacterium RIFCSPHIGHO2_02_FULL_51_22]|uniref:Dihydroorotate dehydrogenase catalytic domain-containing protein n=2 Tax=Candidatus Lloydiibacteriota TaxID=1817910 RepID=A0A1G2D9P0_9BACT|nr:MAG: hypothetical protein A3D67_01050 [Candidatus Lloydbacteria bacterium RIFCSPHIGHO2_02_FULL_51_22]OGZ15025.1 MAG: hypothetical protein A3J08_01610 [Candidatus Lloydbacteria bacterium RIFCSPLOWO2_02_FULL_51_11]
MRLRDVDFGPVWGASGVQGFFGEGYPFHRFIPGLSFEGMTFVAKTTTLLAQVGNMPLREDGITPRHLKPSCIKVYPWKGAALNAVALSGPGAHALLEKGLWQKRTKPFFLSFGAVAKDRAGRVEELRRFVVLLSAYLPAFRTSIGLQINFSCPNTGLEQFMLEEVAESLEIASVLGIPLVPKISVLVSVDDARKIAEHPACDALCISNTIPWGARPADIRWRTWSSWSMRDTLSPLAQFGGGGLSGAPLFPLVRHWLKRAGKKEMPKPICAGGGILAPEQVLAYAVYGARAVSIGSVTMLRPWRVKRLIGTAYKHII